MTRKLGWFGSPAFNWTGVVVSLLMLVLYVQQLGGPESRASTAWVTGAWAAIFAAWLVTAVYSTWFSRKP